MTLEPRVVLVLSGKRKSGKDYVADLLKKRLGENVCGIMRLSGPLKSQYAKEHELDFSKLLDASAYKEQYRTDMIRWGEEKRNKDPGYFCRLATTGSESSKSVWIISDARRKTDVSYFRENYPEKAKIVRIVANDHVRKERGFIFTEGVDDAESECGLDEGVTWDNELTNDTDQQTLEKQLESLAESVQADLKRC